MSAAGARRRPANLLFHADARDSCDRLPPGLTLDFVYLDPPYGVGAEMTARTARGQARGRKQARTESPVAYRDGADVGALVQMLGQVAAHIQPRLAQSGVLCVHMDQRAVHEAKVELDRVFGRNAFLGEVIWTPGNGARGKSLPSTHQTLLFFAKSGVDAGRVEWRIDHPLWREPHADTSLAMHFKLRDADGRRYRERVINGKTYRYFADEGRRLGSVWTDIPAMSANTPLQREGTGYPTQKPEKLLERLIVGVTREGAVVADFMCGSGTTLAVAARLGRPFVGGDRSELAIEITSARLRAQGVAFALE